MIEGVTPTQWAALAKLRDFGARIGPWRSFKEFRDR
jgi:hypothetical protein